MPSGFIVPSTFVREIDLTTQGKLFQTSIAGAVILSLQGDEDDRYITRVEIFDSVYGYPNPSWSFDHYCVRNYLRKGKGIWIKRVTRNARHAGSLVFNDRDGSRATETFYKPFKAGRYETYKSGSQQLLNFKFDGPLITGNVVTFKYADNEDQDNQQVVSVTYTTSNDNTLKLLANAITASMNTEYGILGKAPGYSFVNQIGASVANDRVFTVVAPEDMKIYVEDIQVTAGATQAEAEMFIDTMVMEVYAQNRGKWANDIGYRLLDQAIGINQRLQVAIDRPIVANQRILTRIYSRNSVNGEEVETTLAPIVYASSHALTMTAFANAIKAFLGDASDVYFEDDDTTKLSFTIVSPFDGPKTVEIRALEVENVTGSAVLPQFFVTEVMPGYDGEQAFTIQVYHRSNLNEPLEQRRVSFVKQPDEDGNQLYIEDVLNINDATKSDFIRVKYNPENASAPIIIPAGGTDIYWLAGGDDGALPTTGDIVLGWDAFKSRQTRPMRLLMNNGHTALAVQQKMVNIAKKRFDCIAILDFPSDKQAAQTVFTHRNTNMNLDSNYAGLWSPDVKELDPFRNTELFVPPSGHLAAQFAETDEVAAEWFATAGLNRGVLDTALDLRFEYDEGDMELLISAQVNPIIKRGGVIVSWDQITTQRRNSAFKNISLRRLLIRVEVTIVDGLDYQLHEPNDNYTALAMIQICVGVLQPIKEGRGLYGYAAISDDRNNKNYDYDNQQRNIDVILDPILPIRNIRLSAAVTKKGASFTETITQINGGSVGLGA